MFTGFVIVRIITAPCRSSQSTEEQKRKSDVSLISTVNYDRKISSEPHNSEFDARLSFRESWDKSLLLLALRTKIIIDIPASLLAASRVISALGICIRRRLLQRSRELPQVIRCRFMSISVFTAYSSFPLRVKRFRYVNNIVVHNIPVNRKIKRK